MADMSAHQSGLPRATAQLVGEEREAAVMCGICQAVYVPAQTHAYLLRAPRGVVESAFMSMCHFCFRCRRPSCPACWDSVHGLCGACVLEVKLPFRAEVQPLPGLLFPPVRRAQEAVIRPVTESLVCVRPGRFGEKGIALPAPSARTRKLAEGRYSGAERGDLAEEPTHEFLAVPSPKNYSPLPKQRSERRHVEYADHADGLEEERAAVAEIETRPSSRWDDEIVEQETRPPLRVDDERVEQETRPAQYPGVGGWVERIVTTVLSLVLLCVLVVVGAALWSAAVNELVSRLLHVDIRAEIAYLLHLVQQLFE